MRIIKQLPIVIALALLGLADFVLADIPPVGSVPDTVVVVSGAASELNCSEVTAEHARSLADKASREGSYQRAGACYLASGDKALADQAFIKALAPSSRDTSRRLASNLDQVKAQAHQLTAAFHHRQ
jgi:hypothetical protein